MCRCGWRRRRLVASSRRRCGRRRRSRHRCGWHRPSAQSPRSRSSVCSASSPMTKRRASGIIRRRKSAITIDELTMSSGGVGSPSRGPAWPCSRSGCELGCWTGTPCAGRPRNSSDAGQGALAAVHHRTDRAVQVEDVAVIEPVRPAKDVGHSWQVRSQTIDPS